MQQPAAVRTPLSTAIRAHENALQNYRDTVEEPEPRKLLADSAELILGLARTLEGMPINRAFGSPGDWGYRTAIGKALAEAASQLQSSTPRAIGDKAPGGTIAACMPPQAGIPGYSIVVPELADCPELQWGLWGSNVDGLSDWDGQANTAILATGEHPAARYCAEFAADGLSDFYLPARREAMLLTATTPHMFAIGRHWTSTQRSADYACIQDFRDGYQYASTKNNSFLVRPVRRIIHSPL
jgi:hypothetical protein